MKLTKKNSGLFALLIFLGLLIGTFSWEILERILLTAGAPIDLSAGPIGFDLDVISLFIKVNPGSLVGAAAGVVFFFRL
jgi:hypothetical protein